jgi:hypothetical protein
MYVRFSLLLIVLLTACQSGRIACPEPKYAKLKKSTAHRSYYSPQFAAANEAEEENRQTKGTRSNSKMITHVSVEEWDCPQPGKKKYMPKEVRQNIRKNMKRISSDKETEADSVQTSKTNQR